MSPMPNSAPRFALTKLDYCCAEKQIKTDRQTDRDLSTLIGSRQGVYWLPLGTDSCSDNAQETKGVYGTLYAALTMRAVAISCCLKVHSLVGFCVLFVCSRLPYSFPGATDSSMLCSHQSAVIHSVSPPIVVVSTSCQFVNNIVAHLTELNFRDRFASCSESWTHLFSVFAQLYRLNDVR